MRSVRTMIMRMKIRILSMIVVLPLVAVFLPPAVIALDDPHKGPITCETCHTPSPPATWWTDQAASGGLCGQCHYPGSPNGDAMMHSISASYGTGVLPCTNCHNPHYQKQLRTWKAASYLATGTISAVTTTTLTRSGTTPGWSQNQWKGMLLVPDVRYLQYNYRILSNTASVITIDTSRGDAIKLAYAAPGASFAIVYGGLVKESINGVSVRFLREAGVNSFADGDVTRDGVCEVCHSRTAHFQADGTAPDQLHTSIGSSAAGTRCIACHRHTVGFTGTNAGCLGCHDGPVGNRAAVGSRFRAGSHHVQGVEVTNRHCYQCHWEANDDGTINTTYHSGSAAPGSAVDLVIYGAGTRPASYSVGTTAIQYMANGSRAEINKLTTHCLGCHSDQNNAAQPFAPDDTRTPKQYAWDESSVANRYNQAGVVPWGKYSGAGITPKNTVTKAYSAHGNATGNQGGWDLNETWPNTRNGSVNVQCFDCHNSHGSAASGRTSSYTSATASGGILKDTSAGQGGYSVAYAPEPGGSTDTKNAYNAGAALCFDCHQTQTEGATTPWGYGSTFGASQEVLGYRDSLYFGPGASGYQQRYSYKGPLSHKGGHFGASAPVPGATRTIDGLCTPCHDPHGVTNNTAKIAVADRPYAVPLLKGTWMTSPYKEDVAPAVNTTSTINDTNAGNAYHIDQNTFGSDIMVPVTGITQSDAQFAGLCLTCHPKNSLTDGSNGGTWKSVDRIHESVKGWGANTKHKYTCSKCHTPHNSRLPRLMATNCFNTRHKGRVGHALSPVLSGYSGPNSGWYPFSGGAGSGGGKGTIPGSHGGGEGYDPGTQPYSYVTTCHENQAADQSWNDRTPWFNSPPGVPTLIDEPNTFSTSVQFQWNASTDTEGDAILYQVQIDNVSDFSTPDHTSAWIPGTSYSLTIGNNTTWYWRVRAKDAMTESAWSTPDPFMVSDGNAPPQVPLVSPANGTVYNASSVNVFLQWSAVPPLAQYRLEVDNEPGFSSPLVYDSGWTAATSQWITISTTGIYYWRVQARDTLSLATGAVSETRNFVVNQPPTVPVLIDEPNTTSTSIQLQWNASMDPEGGPIQYLIEIDDASNFLSPNYTSVWISETSYSLTVGNNTIWYWRVKARDTMVESGWSTPKFFIVSDGNAPPQVTLLSPVSGTLYNATSMIVPFQWNAVPPFAQYRLEVDNESGFSSPLVYDSNWIAATNQTVTIPAGTHYWRVQARDTISGTTGLVSDAWTIIVNSPPTVPVLIDEPHTTSTNITLDWNISTDPEGNTPLQYYAVVDDDPNFGSPNFGGVWQLGTSLSFTVGMNTTWYWRVKARDSLNSETAWSSADIFAVSDGVPPPAPTLSNPTNGWPGTTACDTLGYWVTFSYYSEPATEYRVFVDDDPAFGSVNYDSGWTASTSWGADISSNWGTAVYYWKVGARDPANTGTENWSGSQTFTIYYGGGCPKSSCPFVFVWDGQKYGYVTDLQGAPIGYSANSYMAKWPPYFRPEYVVLESPKPDAQGKYNIKLREPLPEISYFDEAKLLAVEYPAGYELASSTSEMTYRFNYTNPFKLYTLKDPRPPVSAVDQNGVNALASALEIDGNLLPMQLFALNSYILDFGPINPANAKLVIDGWSVFGSAYSTTLLTVQPFIEVVNASGQWVKVKSFGEPAGDMKRMVIDLSGLFPSGDRRIRLNTGRDSGMAWRIDKIAIDDSAPVAMTINEINANSADLHYRGRAPYVSATLEHRITALDDVMADDPDSYGFGNFTKYGDVKALLSSTDDMFTIMRHGDEISLAFSGPSAPVPAGMQRSFVLKTDVYYKTFRVNKNVEPLPFHGMSAYPYDPALEQYPNDAEHNQYRAEYNTRQY